MIAEQPWPIFTNERGDEMRLPVFDLIDETLQLLEQNDAFYHEAEQEIRTVIQTLFQDHREYLVDLNSRVKSKESLREKIIRNRFYKECDQAQQILDQLSDLIGVTIECRFIEEEYKALSVLRQKLNQPDERQTYTCEAFPMFHLDVASHQPQIQKRLCDISHGRTI